MLRLALSALAGYALSLLLLQWYIVATREPVRCDGGGKA